MQSLLDNAALHHPSSLRKLLNHGHEIAVLIRRFYLKLKIFMTTFEDFLLRLCQVGLAIGLCSN